MIPKRLSPLLIGCGMSALVVGLGATAVHAQTITPEQVEVLRQEFEPPGFTDERSPQDVQELTAFRDAWEAYNPVIAQFLGEWQNDTDRVVIYPSTRQGTVCVFTYGTYTRFGVGYIDRRQLRIAAASLNDSTGFIDTRFIREGDYLVWSYINSAGEPDALPSFAPVPLQEPANILSAQVLASRLQRFQQAGCTTELPPTERTALLRPRNTDVYASQTIDNVTVRLDGAYVSPGSTSNSFELFMLVDNYSDESFMVFPLRVRVEDARGERVDGRFYFMESSDVEAPPGGQMQGRLVVVRRWQDQGPQNLFLVLEEATMGGRNFRVPIR